MYVPIVIMEFNSPTASVHTEGFSLGPGDDTISRRSDDVSKKHVNSRGSSKPGLKI